jgi:hypothetical protein
MLCGTPLGKSPLLPPSFYDLAIDERFEAVFSPISTEKTKDVPIHCFTSDKCFSILDNVLISRYKHFVLRSVGGCAVGQGEVSLSKPGVIVVTSCSMLTNVVHLSAE